MYLSVLFHVHCHHYSKLGFYGVSTLKLLKRCRGAKIESIYFNTQEKLLISNLMVVGTVGPQST